MSKEKRNSWSKERVCCDCGKVDVVRKDNTGVRCKSCGARHNAIIGAKKFKDEGRSTAVSVSCCHCGKEVVKSRSQLAKAKRHFCSKECMDASSRIYRLCKQCGKQFQSTKGRLSGKTNSSANFCCRDCYNTWLCRTEKVTGRGSRWKAIRAEVLRRSPFCAWCGSVKKQLQVHHIVPYRICLNNEHANLIPLCTKCHKTVEVLTVELEAIGLSAQEVYEVMALFLRQRQVATRALLKRLINDRRGENVSK